MDHHSMMKQNKQIGHTGKGPRTGEEQQRHVCATRHALSEAKQA